MRTGAKKFRDLERGEKPKKTVKDEVHFYEGLRSVEKEGLLQKEKGDLHSVWL